MRRIPEREQGAALLTVLLLVAVVGALSAAAIERLRLSTRLATNIAALDQARSFAIGVESLLALRADDIMAASPERTTLAGGWNGQTRRIPLPGGGFADATLKDGGNCFNINSVADGIPPAALTPRQAGVAQFVALMQLLEIPGGEARRIADAAGDWVDSDQNGSRAGAEDAEYRVAAPVYRTGDTLFAEVSELRAVSVMTAEIYERILPWLCALETAELSQINVNTLGIEQAPLIAMLAPNQIRLEAARQAIAARPASGWSSVGEFYAQPALQSPVLPLDVQLQPQLRTRWFALDLRIERQGAEFTETALVDARIAPARIVARRWGTED